jgi:hypothetical protein
MLIEAATTEETVSSISSAPSSSECREGEASRSSSIEWIINGVLHFITLFPTPMALDGSLRVALSEGQFLFSRILPLATHLWSGVSCLNFAVLLPSTVILGLLPESAFATGTSRRNSMIFSIASLISIVANTIIWISGLNVCALGAYAAHIGELALFPGLVIAIRDCAFVTSLLTAAYIFKSSHREILRYLFSASIVVLSATTGYSYSVGVLSAISCALGFVQIFCPSS